LSLFFSCDPPPLLLPSFPTRRSSDLFVGGVQGRLNNQFAVTIAIAMLISAFNALTLSPALAALLLRPRQSSRGLLARFYGGFNQDRKSTRLNSSHVSISYAVFCLKKK